MHPETLALPSFLEPWEIPGEPLKKNYSNATFPHRKPLESAHSIWWPPRNEGGGAPRTVLLFIPGNPGLLGFYIPFLTAIHDAAPSSSFAILAHAHQGLAATVGVPNSAPSTDAVRLPAQIAAILEVVDAVMSTFGRETKILLVGHSLGAWLSMQALKDRPNDTAGAFLLFPSLSHIGKTPNGQNMSWLFRPPLPRVITTLSVFVRYLPARILSVFFPSWPTDQLEVLRSLLRSPSAIHSCLALANDEMNTIRDLDIALLDQWVDHLWFFFAQKDDWVADQREVILHALHGTPAAVRVVHGHRDIPHAFVINHGKELAVQCTEWLRSGEFI